MRERALKILDATVRGFMATGEPVSSGWLCRRYDFGVKAAMVRSELELLADMGFLEQPHRSAGRIPSDRGFEFFAEKLIQSDFHPTASDEEETRLFERGDWPALLETSFENLGVLGALRNAEKTHTWGIENLVTHLDWKAREEIESVIGDFANMARHLERAEELIEETPSVFVGKHNPITKSKNLAIVGGTYETEAGLVTLLAIGPRHMNYPKIVKMFKNLNRATSGAEQKKKTSWKKK